MLIDRPCRFSTKRSFFEQYSCGGSHFPGYTSLRALISSHCETWTYDVSALILEPSSGCRLSIQRFRVSSCWVTIANSFSHNTSCQFCKARRFGRVAPAIFKHATEKRKCQPFLSTGIVQQKIFVSEKIRQERPSGSSSGIYLRQTSDRSFCLRSFGSLSYRLSSYS